MSQRRIDKCAFPSWTEICILVNLNIKFFLSRNTHAHTLIRCNYDNSGIQSKYFIPDAFLRHNFDISNDVCMYVYYTYIRTYINTCMDAITLIMVSKPKMLSHMIFLDTILTFLIIFSMAQLRCQMLT
jgi:hypothetical protein